MKFEIIFANSTLLNIAIEKDKIDIIQFLLSNENIDVNLTKILQ